MPETKQVIFTYPEIAEELVKRADIHEGYWGIYMEFGIKGANVNLPDERTVPSVLIPVLKVGIQRFDEPNALTVDAGGVNPSSKKRKKKAG